MKNLQVILRTADQSKKAEIDVPENMTGNQVIEAAVNNWLLPKGVTYTLVNSTRNQVLNASQAISKQGVQEGDLLSLDTTLTAGFQYPSRPMDIEATCHVSLEPIKEHQTIKGKRLPHLSAKIDKPDPLPQHQPIPLTDSSSGQKKLVPSTRLGNCEVASE